MKNYQVDRRNENGDLDRYDIVKASSLESALENYLGEDCIDYTVVKKAVNGKTVLTATCPQETSGYLEISRI